MKFVTAINTDVLTGDQITGLFEILAEIIVEIDSTIILLETYKNLRG